MNKILLVLLIILLTSCGGGSSSSGAQVEVSSSGDNIPAAFVGVYKGTLTVVAKAAGITERETAPITITVFDDGTIRFESEGESFTVGIGNDGRFSGNLSIDEDECKGTVGVTGSVDGTTASGTVDGEGECEEGILSIDVDLSGDFSATK